ncbi:MAG TPA: LutB/LldF family L-lactate oxidation iron-sulfur protein [Phycisphaerae bacterium]|jgi:L-lactate dehydrogenase complex protein LldF
MGGQVHSLPVFSTDFQKDARKASANVPLRTATTDACISKDDGRRRLMGDLADPQALRELASKIKAHTIEHLGHYLTELARNVEGHGGVVHFARTGAEANQVIAEIARQNGCKTIVKSKSMATEETQLNHALEAAGLMPIETDLGELIVQLAEDRPSHLIMPVIHMKAKAIGEVFAKFFKVPFTEDPPELAELARRYLREHFRNADMGVSGVNFGIAETGSIVICTNEGNGRMCTTRPRIHVALMGMEKVLPRLADLGVFLKLLARSAASQPITQYTNIISGPRRAGELDGPEQFHLVILDNGRSKIWHSDYQETLHCIRCGACLNACPVYRTIGGHAYGSVYPGPIGALLVPLFNGLEGHADLPQATSLCGACYEACPVKINIPEMLVRMKRDLGKTSAMPWSQRMLFKLWTRGLLTGAGYRLGQKVQRMALREMMPGSGEWVTKLPGAAGGWTDSRDFPKPAKRTFREMWKERER